MWAVTVPFLDPEARRKYKREYRKRQKEAKRQAAYGNPPENSGEPGEPPAPPDGSCVPAVIVAFPPPEPLPLENGRHALIIVRDQINRARCDPRASTQTIARTVGYLMRFAMCAIEATDLADRVAALEANTQ